MAGGGDDSDAADDIIVDGEENPPHPFVLLASMFSLSEPPAVPLASMSATLSSTPGKLVVAACGFRLVSVIVAGDPREGGKISERVGGPFFPSPSFSRFLLPLPFPSGADDVENDAEVRSGPCTGELDGGEEGDEGEDSASTEGSLEDGKWGAKNGDVWCGDDEASINNGVFCIIMAGRSMLVLAARCGEGLLLRPPPLPLVLPLLPNEVAFLRKEEDNGKDVPTTRTWSSPVPLPPVLECNRGPPSSPSRPSCSDGRKEIHGVAGEDSTRRRRFVTEAVVVVACGLCDSVEVNPATREKTGVEKEDTVEGNGNPVLE